MYSPSSIGDGDTTSKRIDKRRYQCDACNKRFTRPSALKTHMYTHTGEKPFECTTPGCGRRFAVISNLRRHFKVHMRTIHTNTPASVRIPASERLRHVQRLMERTAAIEGIVDATSSSSNSNGNAHSSDTGSSSGSSSSSMTPASTPPSPEQHDGFQEVPCYHHHQRHPHHQSSFRSAMMALPSSSAPTMVPSDPPVRLAALYHRHGGHDFSPSWDRLEAQY